MKTEYRCDGCNSVRDNKKDMAEHEKECRLHPKNRACEACEYWLVFVDMDMDKHHEWCQCSIHRMDPGWYAHKMHCEGWKLRKKKLIKRESKIDHPRW